MEVLSSLLVDDPQLDLKDYAHSSVLLSFTQRKEFHAFPHGEFLQKLRLQGIRVRALHAPPLDVFNLGEGEFKSTLLTARDVYQAELVTLHPQRGHQETSREHFHQLEKDVEELGLLLAYESYEREVPGQSWKTQLEDFHRWFDLFSNPRFKVTYDFVRAPRTEDWADLQRNLEQVEVIHFSDALRDKPVDLNQRHEHLPLGYGNFKVLDFVDFLREAGYDRFLVLDYHGAYKSLEKSDAQALRDYWEGREDPLLEILDDRASHRKKEDR